MAILDLPERGQLEKNGFLRQNSSKFFGDNFYD